MTPHLGYLTNWHSQIQSVKLSLSNTLSGGPDHHRWLCRINEQAKHSQIATERTCVLCKDFVFMHKIPKITCWLLPGVAPISSFWSSLSAPLHSQWWHCVKTIRLTIKLQHCKGEVKTRKITAQLALRKYVEIKCQHVTVVKCCWKLSVAHSFWDNGLLRHMRQFGFFFFLHAPFVEFVQSHYCAKKLLMELHISV